MLQVIREKIQGWIAGIISAVVIFSFAFWGIHSYFNTGSTINSVAEVNGVEITKEQFSSAYERMRKEAQSRFVNLSEQEGKLKEQALQELINIEVLKQSSIAQGYFISINQIDNYLQSMPEFQVEGQFSLERFNELLSSKLLSTQDLYDLIKTNLLIGQPKLGIIFTAFSLPNEVEQAISLLDQTRSVLYSVFSVHSFTYPAVSISDEVVSEYYKKHQFEFKTPETVSVNYIQLTLDDVKKKINPSTDELKKFYNDNSNSYAEPVQLLLSAYEINYSPDQKQEIETRREQAEHLLESLKSGHASPASTDIKTMSFSNRFISIADLPALLRKDASQLTKANAFSSVIDTGKSYVVLQLKDMKAPRVKTFEEVKKSVHDGYVKQKSEELFAELREKLADLTYRHPNSLDVAAKELGLSVRTSGLFSKDKPFSEKDLSSHKKVRDLAFSNDILKMSNNSDVLSLDANSATVIRLNSHVLPSVIPFSNVSSQIKEQLKQMKIEKQFKSRLDQMVSELNAGKDVNALAARDHFTWKKTDYIGRYAYSSLADPMVLDAAFSMPVNNDQKNQFALVKLAQNKYAIVSLLGVKFGEAKDDKQTSVFSEQLQSSFGMMEYQLYADGLSKEAKINVFASFDGSSGGVK